MRSKFAACVYWVLQLLRGFLLWLIRLTGKAAKHVVGSFLATCLFFFILLLLVLPGAHTLVMPAGSSGWLNFVFGAFVLIFGTLTGSLAGLIWPDPFLRLAQSLDDGIPDAWWPSKSTRDKSAEDKSDEKDSHENDSADADTSDGGFFDFDFD